MSNPTVPSDSSKPVVKDKNPHNYRKVGYSMIVISVSLVLIGLLVWAIGDNYHFSGDIMAKQEIESMTPKAGYMVVAFDYTQPIGAKLQLLGSASTLEDATKLQNQYIPNYNGQKGQVLIFDTSITNNTNSISLAEIYALTPTFGYDVVSFNTVMPVGARLAPQTLDPSLGAAMNDSARYSTANADKQVQILTFTSSFDDNLKQVLGPKYAPELVSENINKIKSMPQKMVPPPAPVKQNAVNVTATVNATAVNATEKITVTTNIVPNGTSVSLNKTAGTMMGTISMTENVTASSSSNSTTAVSNHTSSNHTKTIVLSESLKVNSTSK